MYNLVVLSTFVPLYHLPESPLSRTLLSSTWPAEYQYSESSSCSPWQPSFYFLSLSPTALGISRKWSKAVFSFCDWLLILAMSSKLSHTSTWSHFCPPWLNTILLNTPCLSIRKHLSCSLPLRYRAMLLWTQACTYLLESLLSILLIIYQNYKPLLNRST